MLDRIDMTKGKMEESIAQLCETDWMFSKRPGKDFSRTKKLPFF